VLTHSANSVRPQVLSATYPYYDSARNRGQLIRLLFCCGHEEQYLSLDLGKGWKPRTKRQIFNDELRITCPAAYKLCRECSTGSAS
jgi:hypothetical protein